MSFLSILYLDQQDTLKEWDVPQLAILQKGLPV